MNVAVTGASGFLGRALMLRLQSEGLAVRGYSRRDEHDLHKVASYADLAPADVIFHCAETSDAAQVAKLGEQLQDESLALTKTLAGKAGRLIYASSAIVYGDSNHWPRREDEPVSAVNAYAQMKLNGEHAVAEAGGTSLRLVNLCGPQQPKNTVLYDIMQQLRQPGPLSVRNTDAIRDFLWITDAAEAMALAVNSEKLPPVLNVGSGAGVSIGSLASRILREIGQPDREVVSAFPPVSSSLYLDMTRTREALGWVASQKIEQGVLALIGKE